MKSLCFWALIFTGLCTTNVRGAEDLLIADFEGKDFGDWKVTGDAFGSGPAQGTLPNQMHVEGFLGHGLVNSFHNGDKSTGTLTSPPFKIERRIVKFLIGGGGYVEETYMELLVGGKRVRQATGPNTNSGGSERLSWSEWEVTDLIGQQATIRIVDARTGGWGHLNVDQIMQSDRPLPATRTNATREFVFEKRYLNLPVKNGAPKKMVSLLIDGKIERQFEIELADADPDWWAFMDLEPFRGKQATLRIDKLLDDSSALSLIDQADEFRGSENLYRERLRPQFHFTSRRGWNNDPNGLVLAGGQYHLFYQHNPYGWNWGNMHWGHAVSHDLVHWQELGEALYPDALGTMFSGSAVVDYGNTSGWGEKDRPPLVCIYTAAGDTSLESKGKHFTQCVAYSLDGGQTWKKYEKNPVLEHVAAQNRDPKVVWYEPDHKWIMALYLDRSDFALFESTDLKSWKRLSDVKIPGTSECPEFFEIKVEGSDETRWIFYGGNGRYIIGGFDGKNFTPESGPHPLNFGNCFYASQTYSTPNMLRDDRILVAWGQVNLAGMPFNQMMDFPIDLKLHSTPAGLRLAAAPVKTIETLRIRSKKWTDQSISSKSALLSDIQGELFDVEASFTGRGLVTFNVRGIDVTCDLTKGEVRCLKNQMPLAAGPVHLRFLVDRASIEIFANGGYMPMGVILDPTNRSIGLEAREGEAMFSVLAVHELKPSWR